MAGLEKPNLVPRKHYLPSFYIYQKINAVISKAI
jgi:hypothetical protein